MPLEMFDGKTGPRLIARLPVADGSYAVVTLATDELNPSGGKINLAWVGASVNGYPALSPLQQSLLDLIPQISNLMSAEKRRILVRAGSWEKLAAELETMQGKSDAHTSLGGAIASVFVTLDQIRALNAAKYLKRMGSKVPICPRVMPGQQLFVKLPSIYQGLSTVVLGTVTSVSIHNKELPAPSN